METIEVYAYVARGLSGAPADTFGIYVTGDQNDQPKPLATWTDQSYWALSADATNGYPPVLMHVYYEGALPSWGTRDYINKHVQTLTGQLLANEERITPERAELPIEKHKATTNKVMKDRSPLDINLSVMETWLVIGAIQMATRDRGLHTNTKNCLETAARKMQAAVLKVHPDAEELIELGWNPEYDR